MYKSNLLKKDSRLNQTPEKKNYDQTLFPRIDKKIISVYKIADQPKRFLQPILVPYVDQNYWDDYYTQEELV